MLNGPKKTYGGPLIHEYEYATKLPVWQINKLADIDVNC
jgi:hypothetical protein